MSIDNQSPPESSNGTTSTSRLAALVGFDEETTNQSVRTLKLPTIDSDVEDDTPIETRQGSRERGSRGKDAQEQGEGEQGECPFPPCTLPPAPFPLHEATPKDTPTSRPQWGKPTNKAYLVLAASAIVILVAYLAMAKLMSPPVKKPAETAKKLQDFPVPTTNVEDQTGKLKASLALSDQVEAVKKLNQEYQQKKSPPASPPSPPPKPKKALPVAETRLAPVRDRVIRLVPPTPPRRVPYLQPKPLVRVTPPPVKQPTVAKTLEPQPNPLAVWQQLAQTGSYGQTSGGVSEDILVADSATKNQATTVVEDQQVSVVEARVDNIPAFTKDNLTAKPMITATTEATTTTAMQPRESVTSSPLKIDEVAEAAVISGRPIRTAKLLTATTAAASLVTPLSWSDDLQATNAPQMALQLEQPLQASDGTNVLPRGTRLIAQVSNVGTSGLVEATVISVVVPQGKDTQEIALSPGVIVLTGSKGMPLIAKAKQQKHSRAGINLGRVLKDVIDQRYENLPENLTLRNIRAGGGSGTLWYLPAGESIEIFVNSSFELNLL